MIGSRCSADFSGSAIAPKGSSRCPNILARRSLSSLKLWFSTWPPPTTRPNWRLHSSAPTYSPGSSPSPISSRLIFLLPSPRLIVSIAVLPVSRRSAKTRPTAHSMAGAGSPKTNPPFSRRIPAFGTGVGRDPGMDEGGWAGLHRRDPCTPPLLTLAWVVFNVHFQTHYQKSFSGPRDPAPTSSLS